MTSSHDEPRGPSQLSILSFQRGLQLKVAPQMCLSTNTPAACALFGVAYRIRYSSTVYRCVTPDVGRTSLQSGPRLPPLGHRDTVIKHFPRKLSGRTAPSRLAELLRKAVLWRDQLHPGLVGTQAEIARREGLSRPRVARCRSRSGSSNCASTQHGRWRSPQESPLLQQDHFADLDVFARLKPAVVDA